MVDNSGGLTIVGPTPIADKQQSTSITTTIVPTPLPGIHVPILLYHYVEYIQNTADTIRVSLNINPNIFEQQVQTLVSAGYTFITAKDLGNILDGSMALPKNPVILTFDDGHWDLDTDVLPILERYNVKATAYIITGYLGNPDSLSPSQLQDVINSGLVEIGAHTVDHKNLTSLNTTLATYEIDTSKSTLEQDYNIHVYSFAYPYGGFNSNAIQIVKNDGFTNAVSTLSGTIQNNQNRYYLSRIRPGDRTGQTLINFINQNIYNYAASAD